MAESRRNFFRRFLGQEQPTSAKRAARYQVLETYTRTQLLPYDFTLTNTQERELIAAVRYALERAPDDELFSNRIRPRIHEVVNQKIGPWREMSQDTGRAERLREVRLVAQDYVSEFMASESNAPTIEKMKETYRIDNPVELEAVLREQIKAWINQVDDRLIEQCDVISVRDIVFAQLRSWC